MLGLLILTDVKFKHEIILLKLISHMLTQSPVRLLEEIGMIFSSS